MITMNETTKLEGLSYKQLQALAIRYKVPGNIRKNLLIKVLEAVREGNDLEVNKILRELHQTRKKRVKKSTKQLGKLVKLKPITSYGPEFNKDIRFAVNVSQPPPGWVINTGEEETATRDLNGEENRAQIPIYPEFNQFLGGGIQDDYCYHTNAVGNPERSTSPGIVDLRINPRRICEWNEIDIPRRRRFTDFAHHETSAIDYKHYNGIEPSHLIQYESPRLLKKMLQAPAGVNLKQLVSYEQSYDIPTMNNEVFDDSDTLTADSDINDNFMDPTHHNNNWLANSNEILRAYGDHRVEHYEFNCNASTEVIENCQKWLASSSSMLNNKNNNNDSNNSNNSNNETVDIVDNDYYNQNQVHHPLGVIKSHENLLYYGNPEDQYYNFNVSGNNDNQCEYQQQSHPQYECDINMVEDIGRVGVVYHQDEGLEGVTVQNHHQWPVVYPMHHNRESLETLYEANVVGNVEESPYEEFHIAIPEDNSGNDRYPQYIKTDYAGSGEFTGGVTNVQESEALEQWANLQPQELSVPDNAVDCYWPQWSASEGSRIETSRMNYKLENLLNLEKTSYEGEQIKSDQTSSVYCYTAPIVTQRIFSSPSPPSQMSFIESEIQGSNGVPCGDIQAPVNQLENIDFVESQNLKSSTVVINPTTDPYSICENIDMNAADAASIQNNRWISDYVTIEAVDSAQCYNC
ncbi:uncharacterized protein [Fopius arisanus]|uniref:Uncharacterized protein n=1 Tax=Fopius arisanus TaxID=64838 RepID=A0A0C9RSX4_9HYME|nr:PREDICTED: uncharacterized protein LOC105262743 [Fopius arisanus]XP_011296781.1 PREDICTED: uncharacterized protein LOC105262743 [Fopius arisanus]